MLKLFLHQPRRRAEGGFTLIELVVVLAILGIIIALAVPRYLGARRRGYLSEARNILQEVKTLEWAYFQQYNSFFAFGPVSNGQAVSEVGFTTPTGTPPKFAYSAVTTDSNSFVDMRASGFGVGQPWSDIRMSLNLTSTGNSTLTESF